MCFPFRSLSRQRCVLVLSGLLLVFDSGCEGSKVTLHETAPMNGVARSGAGNRATRNPYEENPYAQTEGQRLYDWYNCSGCHARGGGGIGPPLMADVFKYGKEPTNIYTSIVDGRPNGMPSWRGKLTEFEAWQLVTYVQTLDPSRGIASSPGPREEHMQAAEGQVSR